MLEFRRVENRLGRDLPRSHPDIHQSEYVGLVAEMETEDAYRVLTKALLDNFQDQVDLERI
jgi:hypothetical protein